MSPAKYKFEPIDASPVINNRLFPVISFVAVNIFVVEIAPLPEIPPVFVNVCPDGIINPPFALIAPDTARVLDNVAAP